MKYCPRIERLNAEYCPRIERSIAHDAGTLIVASLSLQSLSESDEDKLFLYLAARWFKRREAEGERRRQIE